MSFWRGSFAFCACWRFDPHRVPLHSGEGRNLHADFLANVVFTKINCDEISLKYITLLLLFRDYPKGLAH